MNEILTAFGVDWRLLVIQIFNFAILLAALWYFLYTPVLKLLHDRREKIEQGVRDAEEAAVKLEKADEERGEILGVAHKEAGEIVSRAEEYAKEKEGMIIADAQERGERILESADKKAREQQAEMLKASEGEIAKMAVLAAEKVLREKP